MQTLPMASQRPTDPGLRLRAAQLGDEAAVAAVHVRSWQAGYRGVLPDAYLDSLDPADRAGRYTFGSTDPAVPFTMLAVSGDVVCGFLTTMPPADPEVGEIGALYVDPAWWRRGVGRLLMDEACTRLVDAGHREAVLWVLEGNVRGLAFYAELGWVPDGARQRDEVWGITVEEVCLRRRLAEGTD